MHTEQMCLNDRSSEAVDYYMLRKVGKHRHVECFVACEYIRFATAHSVQYRRDNSDEDYMLLCLFYVRGTLNPKT